MRRALLLVTPNVPRSGADKSPVKIRQLSDWPFDDPTRLAVEYSLTLRYFSWPCVVRGLSCDRNIWDGNGLNDSAALSSEVLGRV